MVQQENSGLLASQSNVCSFPAVVAYDSRRKIRPKKKSDEFCRTLRPPGTVFNVVRQLGWEGSLGENGSVYMCGCFRLLST